VKIQDMQKIFIFNFFDGFSAPRTKYVPFY
jgi:hypothetical protein